jgi:carboxypeptidase T
MIPAMPTHILSVVLLAVSALSPFQDADDSHRLVVVDALGLPAGSLAGMGLDVLGPTPDGSGIEVIARDRELALLADSGLSYTVTIGDLESYYADRLVPSAEPLGAVGGSITPAFGQGGMGGYHTYAEVASILDQLTALYPQIMTGKFSLGSSLEGREIWAVKISDNPGVDENEPEVRFDALHHAREPMSMESTLYYMIWLLENYGIDPLATYLVDERETWFVPVVNPDGYVYNEMTNPNGGGLWRKNRRDNGGSFGVDLNRNYPFRWGFDDAGSSPTPSDTTYRGPAPASEPETQAMVALMASRNFRTALSSHAYGNIWLAPWGYATILPPDDDDLDEVGALATRSSGFPYGPAFVLLYPANGVTFDQDYGAHGTFAWTPEIGTSSQGFWPPISNLIALATSVLEGFQATAMAAGPYVLHRGTTLVDLGDGDGDFEPGETVGVIVDVRNSGRGSGTPNGTLMSNSAQLTVTNGSESLGTVASFSSADNTAAPLLMTIDPGATPGSSLAFTTGVDWSGPDPAVGGTLMVGVPEPDQWTDLGGGTNGINGVPALTATGTLVPAAPFQIDLLNAAPSMLMLAWLSFNSAPIGALGGTLHANPVDVQFLRLSDATGSLSEGGPWPVGVPSGTELTLQFLVQDLSVRHEITLSNGVTATAP